MAHGKIHFETKFQTADAEHHFPPPSYFKVRKEPMAIPKHIEPM